MHSIRPVIGEARDGGPPSEPRPAATVMLVRDGEQGLELLLVHRDPSARVMPNAWVFPGGTIDATDGEGEQATRVAAVRELAEETGIELSGPEALTPFSRWITPRELAARFDTWFFVALAPPGCAPRADGCEIVGCRWFTPSAALAAVQAGEILLAFPTISHIEQIATYATASRLIERARDMEIQPVLPRVIGAGADARVVLAD